MATLEEASADLKLNHENLSQTITSCVVQWKGLDSHFSSIHTSLQSLLKTLISKQKTLNLKEETLFSKEKALELETQALILREEGLISKEKTLISKEETLNSKEKALISKEEDLISKEETLESHDKALNSREKTLDTKEQALILKEKTLILKEKDLISKEKALKFNSQEGKFKVKIEPEVDYEIRENANLRFSVSMDGRGLQIFLNERVSEHDRIKDEVYVALGMSADPAKLVLDALQGFYNKGEKFKKGDKVFEISVVRKSCVLLLEQLIRVSPRVSGNVREEAKREVKEWEGKMREEMGDDGSLEVLGFLLILSAYGLASEFDRDKIVRLFGILPKERQLVGLRCALDIPDEVALSVISHSTTKNDHSPSQNIRLNNVVSSGIIDTTKKIEQSLSEDIPENNTVASLSCQWPEIKSFCFTMDDHGLRTFLSHCPWKHEAMRSEVYDALQCAPDPVKLVLDTIQNLSLLPADVSKRKLEHNRLSCILLLEQLGRLSLQIESSVKEEAMRAAVSCKEKLVGKKENPHEALLFLQLVATFGLASSFDADELVHLLGALHSYKRSAELFRALGLVHKMHRIVRTIVKKKHHLEALRHIYEFDLVDKFPPVPLLEAHVNFSKMYAKKIAGEGNNSHRSQIRATKVEMDALRAVIKCVTDHKLESQYLTANLYERIAELEKQYGCGEGTAQPASFSKADELVLSEKKRSRTTVVTATESNVSVCTNSTIVAMQPPEKKKGYERVIAPPAPSSNAQPCVQNGNKRHRTTVSTEAIPNVSACIASTIPSLQLPQHLTDHCPSYPNTSTGYYNFGAPNLAPLHMRPFGRPYAAADPGFVSPRMNSLATQYGSGVATNVNMGMYNFSGAYSVGMHVGNVIPNSSFHYYPSFHTQ